MTLGNVNRQNLNAPGARLATLDAARGVAALLVIIFHMRSYGHVKFETFAGTDFFSKAYLAVDFFFLLSGFVITMCYEDKLTSGRMSLSRFFALRGIRLYPLYLVGTLFGITGALWLNPEIIGNAHLLALSLFGLPQILPDPAVPPLYPFNGVAWSLGCEVLVNVAWALVLIRLPMRYVGLVFIVSSVAMIKFGSNFGSLMFGSFTQDLPGALARVFVSFTLGQMLFHAMGQSWFPRFNLNSAAVLSLLALSLLAPVTTLGLTFDFSFVFLFAPLLVAMGARVEPGAALRGLCHQLGRLSYALYVVHLPCLKFVNWMWSGVIGAPIADTPLLGIVVALGFILFVSHIATALFDEPVRLVLNQWLKTRKPSSMPKLA